MPVDPFQYSTPQANLLVKRLIVTDYANIPGGSSTGVAFGGVYTCTGSENPAGFPVPAACPSSYVAMVQGLVRAASGAIVPAVALPASFVVSDAQFLVACNAQPAAGDLLVFVVAPT